MYADGTYSFTDRLSLTAGARYTSDSKDFEHHANGGGACNQFTKAKDATRINANAPFTLANCKSDARSNALSRIGLRGDQYDGRKNLLPNSQFGLNVNASDHWEDPTFRVALNFKPNDTQLVYGTVATGYISGGFSETCSSVVTCRPFSEEKNVNFEVGYKAGQVGQHLRRAAGNIEARERGGRAEPDRAAVGRPERSRRALGARQRPRLGLIEPPQPEPRRPVTRCDEDEGLAVGRQGKLQRRVSGGRRDLHAHLRRNR